MQAGQERGYYFNIRGGALGPGDLPPEPVEYRFPEIPGVNVELRFGDPRRDARALAQLYSDPMAISHLAGVAPPLPEEEIRELRGRLALSSPPISPILVATEAEVREYYRRRSDRIIVVQNPSDKRVIGTVAIEMPGVGIATPTLVKLVVSSESRGEGIARALVIQGAAFAFAPPSEGGLGYDLLRANVIVGIRGEERPLNLFLNEGYRIIGQPEEGSWSWDVDQRRFVRRSAVWLQLPIETFYSHHSEFKKNSPPVADADSAPAI